MIFNERQLMSVGCLVLASVIGGCSSDYDGLQKYPVTGTVLVDGKPAGEVRVYFVKVGAGGTSNADYPVGVTDADGRFALSTNGKNDGAVAGDYVVLFEWPEANGPGAKDRLVGKYMNAAESEHRVTISEQENILDAFELQGSATAPRREVRNQLDENDRPFLNQ